MEDRVLNKKNSLSILLLSRDRLGGQERRIRRTSPDMEDKNSPGMEDSRPATAGCKGKLPRLAAGRGE